MKKVTDGTAGYYDTAPNYTVERGEELRELGLQLGDAHAEIRRQAKELEGLMWLEQQHWDKDELFELVNNWKTKDGTRHPGGLMDAIGAAIAQQTKETE